MLIDGNRLSLLFCLGALFAGCATSGISTDQKKYSNLLENNLESFPYQTIELANKIIATNNSNSVVYYLRARAFQKVNNNVAAEKDFEQALKLSPENESYTVAYANLLCAEQNYQKAQTYYDSAYNYAKRAGNSLTLIYINNGDCLTTQNKLDAAITSYTSALSDESAPVTAYIGIAHAYLLQENYPIANYYLGFYRGVPTQQFLQIRIITLNDLIKNTSKAADRTRLEQTLKTLQQQSKVNGSSQFDQSSSVVVNESSPQTAISHNDIEIKEAEAHQSIKQVSTISAKVSSDFSSRIQVGADGRRYIIIKPGDTLFRIGVNSNISTTRLKEINHLRSNDITIASRFFLD